MLPIWLSCSLIALGWTLVAVFVYFTTGETIMDKILKLLYWVLTKSFFREITVSHAERIPKDKPVMLVCAPHANQFVDAMIISTHLNRKIYYIGAASSFRKYKVVGFFMKLMQSIIPVERHQDLKSVLEGKATIKANHILGENTRFTEQVKVEGMVVINEGTYIVKDILSDTDLVIDEEKSKPKDIDVNMLYDMTYFPHIDYHKMFSSVWDHLKENQCVAIFPEGGSHDQSHISFASDCVKYIVNTYFLPFKVGVSIMSLGFMDQNPEADFYLIPVGLNYFKRDAFREARAYIDVGEPIEVGNDLVKRYGKGGDIKKEAVNQLLSMINMTMNTVTTMAPDWPTLNCVNTARHVLTGKDIKLTTEQKSKLNRNLVNACKMFENDERVNEIREHITDYQELLKCTHQSDYQISKGCVSITKTLAFSTITTVLQILVSFIVSIPGFIISFPGLVAVSIYSQRYRRNALRKSTVKIHATDVLATGKIVSAAICFIILILVEPAMILLIARFYYNQEITFLDYLGIANILPWLFYACIFCGDYCIRRVIELKNDIWTLLFPNMDRYIIKQRAAVKDEILKEIEKKGPELFGTPGEFERKRVLKDGGVSMKRVPTTINLQSYLPRPISLSNLESVAQDVIPQIFY